jgi:cobalt/nickel transport system permease protein
MTPTPAAPGDADRYGPDPRALLLATLVYVVAVASFPPEALAGLAPLALVAAVGVALAPLPARVLARRLALAAPFALMVGLAGPWLDPRPAVAIGGFVLSAGWLGFAVIVLKVLLSVTAVVVLTALCSSAQLSLGLRGLRVPTALVTQVVLLGRYLEVLRHEATSMRRARELRSAGARRARQPRVVAVMLGVLLHRSLDRGERIGRAMLGRGFDGTIPSWRPSDTLLLAAVTLGCAAARALPLAEWLGRGLLG